MSRRIKSTLLLFVVSIVAASASLAEVVTLIRTEVEKVRLRTNDEPLTTTSDVFANLPQARLFMNVRQGDTDTIRVSFTAECRLIQGVGESVASEWVEMRAEISTTTSVAGFPTFMEPYDTGSPMAFCSSDVWSTQHASWAMKVSGGITYRVRIQWRVNDSDNTGWIDDSMLEVALLD